MYSFVGLQGRQARQISWSRAARVRLLLPRRTCELVRLPARGMVTSAGIFVANGKRLQGLEVAGPTMRERSVALDARTVRSTVDLLGAAK